MPVAKQRLTARWTKASGAAIFWLASVIATGLSGNAAAQSLSNPFGEPETSRPRSKPQPAAAGLEQPYLAPMTRDNSANTSPEMTETPGWTSHAPAAPGPAYLPGDDSAGLSTQAVERIDLDPVSAPDGSGLPYELWGGLSVGDVEALLAGLEIPPKSPALHTLWRRLITSAAAPPSGGAGSARFTALRAEILYRSGLVKEAFDVVAAEPAATSDPMLEIMQARLDIGQGRREQACNAASRIATLPADMPVPLKLEALLIGGYCAAVADDLNAVGLKATLARELSPDQTFGADALEMIAAGARPEVPKDAKISLLDYRIVEFGKGELAPEAIATASPALLAALALGADTASSIRLAAAEAAARVNAIAPAELAEIYRARANEASNPDRTGPPLRAEVFAAADAELTPARKTRLVRAFLDESRRAELYWPALIMMEKSLDSLPPVADIGWFAETAIEIALASARYDVARRWAEFSSRLDGPQTGAASNHWLALADIADPALNSGRSANLGNIEDLAGTGRIDANTLHRLVTVLDALEVQVPIPLWDKASRTEQPNTGYLPETGVLSQLQEASKKKEFGRTVLLAMRALGPSGADSANLIALGDSIRALRRAGLEADARRLGLEALFASWPRAITN